MTLDGMTAVERRIAELAGERATPPSSKASDTVGAFAALLGSAGAVPGAPLVAAVAPASAALERLIANASSATGTDPALVTAIVANESGFDPAATSAAGARGLMQLMPGTSAALGVRDSYDPAQNITGGARYLAQLLQRFSGDVPAALAAYNAGPNAVERGIVPAETQTYVANVMESYARYHAIQPSR